MSQAFDDARTVPYLFRLFLNCKDWVRFDRSHHCRSRFPSDGGRGWNWNLGTYHLFLSAPNRRVGELDLEGGSELLVCRL